MKRKNLREQISRILIQWSMPTRQQAINQIVELLDAEPCCGHNCCCNREINSSKKNEE